MGIEPEIFVAGHICLDIIPEILSHTFGENAHIEPGKLKVIGPVACATGGCVANTGLTLHQLGVSTSLMGKIGNDAFGNEVLNIVSRTNEKLAEGMTIAEGESTSYSLVFSPPGVDRSFLHCPGANNTFSGDDVSIDQLKNAKLFHFGYPPLENPTRKAMALTESAELTSWRRASSIRTLLRNSTKLCPVYARKYLQKVARCIPTDSHVSSSVISSW